MLSKYRKISGMRGFQFHNYHYYVLSHFPFLSVLAFWRDYERRRQQNERNENENENDPQLRNVHT